MNATLALLLILNLIAPTGWLLAVCGKKKLREGRDYWKNRALALEFKERTLALQQLRAQQPGLDIHSGQAPLARFHESPRRQG